jgi:hypothetical protein
VDSSAGSSEVSATGASAFRPLRLCGNKQNYFNTVTGQCLSKGEVGLSGPAAAMVPSAAPLPVVCQKKLFFNTLTEKCLSRDEVARE